MWLCLWLHDTHRIVVGEIDLLVHVTNSMRPSLGRENSLEGFAGQWQHGDLMTFVPASCDIVLGAMGWSNGSPGEPQTPVRMPIELPSNSGQYVDVYMFSGCRPYAPEHMQLLAVDLAGNRIMAKYGLCPEDGAGVTTDEWTQYRKGGGWGASDFEYNADCVPVDCVGEWSECTDACEPAADRTFEVTAHAYGGGSACPTSEDAEACCP